MEIENLEQEFYEHYRFVADPGQEPMRIDKWLMHKISNASRTKIQAAIEAGSVFVNNKTCKSNYKIKAGEEVKILLAQPPRDTEIIPEDIALEVVFEDEHLLIVNKPAGMVVHPGYNNYTGTLVNALAFRYQDLPQKDASHRPGLVHRIDKDTSGLLVVGKSDFVLQHLAKQFFDHSIHRRYWAICWGEPTLDKGTIQGYLARDTTDRRKSKNYDSEEKGKIAITHYKILEKFYFATLVSCTLETGRTHQIRAQMASIGHPLFADEMYGGMEIKKGSALPKFKPFIENSFQIMSRQALHARELGFVHPITGENMYFEIEPPADFITILDRFRTYVGSN